MNEETENKQYPKCWLFNVNKRVYQRDKDGKSSGAPIWREHWQKNEIVGETRVSWIGRYGNNIPKKGGHGICFSEQELDELTWVHENRYPIAEQVRRADYAKLKAISEILDTDNQTQ